jgi:hypothetical protein
MDDLAVPRPVKYYERRRSPRSVLKMPLVVLGQLAEKKSFREETSTISVNAYGARSNQPAELG